MEIPDVYLWHLNAVWLFYWRSTSWTLGLLMTASSHTEAELSDNNSWLVSFNAQPAVDKRHLKLKKLWKAWKKVECLCAEAALILTQLLGVKVGQEHRASVLADYSDRSNRKTWEIWESHPHPMWLNRPLEELNWKLYYCSSWNANTK